MPYVNIGDWEPEPPSAEDEARLPKDLSAPYPGEVLVQAPAGSAIICNSSMWHSGTLKQDNSYRRMLHLTYTRRDLPEQLLQLDYLTEALYNRMSPEQRYLHGNRTAQGRRRRAAPAGQTRQGLVELRG